MNDPLILLQRFALPLVLAAVWSLIVARRGETPADRARWTWPGIAVAFLLAQPPGLAHFQGWPWTMPGVVSGLALVLVAIGVALPTTWRRSLVGEGLLAAGLLLVALPTHNWGNQGVLGWLVWLLVPVAALVLAAGARQLIGTQAGRGVGLWALLFLGAPLIAVAHANTAAALVLASFALALGGAAIAGLLRGNDFLAGGLQLLPAAVLVLVLVNTQLRYVPGPSEAAWEVWSLALAPVLLLAAPWLWRLVAGPGSSLPRLLAGAALAVLPVAIAVGLPLAAYFVEGETSGGSDPGWDYGSIGR